MCHISNDIVNNNNNCTIHIKNQRHIYSTVKVAATKMHIISDTSVSRHSLSFPFAWCDSFDLDLLTREYLFPSHG